MKIAILGAGNVGAALGERLASVGHEVVHGVRQPEAEKYSALRDKRGVRAVPEAVAGADVVLLATPWSTTQAALIAAGGLAGQVVIDATNPIGPGFTLTHAHEDSGAEQVQRWAPEAKVVKAFNTTGVENMNDPVYGDDRALMLVCGDDEAACQTTVRLARQIGFDALAIGPLERARVLEPVGMLWIQLALKLGNGRNIALGLARRAS